MASNALVRLTNNGSADLTFEVDIAKPVKFVSQLVLPPGRVVEVEIETIMPMVLFDRHFQNAIVAGTVTIAFVFTTSGGVASTSSRYLANVIRFLSGLSTGWQSV